MMRITVVYMRPEDYKSRTKGLKFEASRSGWSKPGNQKYNLKPSC